MITNGTNFQKGIEKIDFSGWLSGRVVLIDETTNEIGVVLPKLIPTSNEYSKPSENELILKENCLLNTNDTIPEFNYSIIKKNYIMVKPFLDLNKEIIKPNIGSTILVVFLDNDPQKPYYLPFTI